MNKIIISIAVVIAVGFVIYLIVGRSTSSIDTLLVPSESPSATQTVMATPSPVVSMAPSPTFTPVAKLVVQTLLAGKGVGVKTGDKISVHYTGMLVDGTVFDSSIPRGKPFDFTLGVTSLIQGWQQGLVGMKVGEKRRLIIPPDLGYGATGVPGSPIGANATLVFDIELLSIQ